MRHPRADEIKAGRDDQTVQAFVKYRRTGGTKNSPLPDFYIGAHTEAEGLMLVIRDATRYRTYFPSVSLITP